MLNPSTADEFYNDPTVLRCENRAILEGYKSLIVTNVFAFRATEPKDMKAFYSKDLTEEYFKNFKHIEKIAEKSDKIICAWGNDGGYLKTSEKIRDILKEFQEKIFYLKMQVMLVYIYKFLFFIHLLNLKVYSGLKLLMNLILALI